MHKVNQRHQPIWLHLRNFLCKPSLHLIQQGRLGKQQLHFVLSSSLAICMDLCSLERLMFLVCNTLWRRNRSYEFRVLEYMKIQILTYSCPGKVLLTDKNVCRPGVQKFVIDFSLRLKGHLRFALSRAIFSLERWVDNIF